MLYTSSIASRQYLDLSRPFCMNCFLHVLHLSIILSFIASCFITFMHLFTFMHLDHLYAGAEPEGGEGGHLPPLTPKISLHMYSTLVTPWHREKMKKKKKDSNLKVTQEKERKKKLLSKTNPHTFSPISLFL